MTGTRTLPAVAAVAMAFVACATSVCAHPHGVKITGIYSDLEGHFDGNGQTLCLKRKQSCWQ